MHNYTHEYKMVAVKDSKGRTIGKEPLYVGSRCSQETCQDNRRPATLDLVKAHNSKSGGFFGTTGQTRVVTDNR